MSILHFFRRKNQLKLVPGLTLSLELEDDGGKTMMFEVAVRDIEKRKVVLAPATGPLASGLTPGLKVRIAAVQDEVMYAYAATLIDVSNFLLEASLPGAQVEDAPFPRLDSDARLDVCLPVQYRALRTHHTQNGEAVAVSGKGLALCSRVGIPNNTELLINVSLPVQEARIAMKGRSVGSAPRERRFVTEVESSDIEPADLRRLWQFCALDSFRSSLTGGLQRPARREALSEKS